MAYTTIDNPELHFQVKTYSGDGSAQSITLDGDEDMQPDFIWGKRRNSSAAHELYDSVRGTTKYLISNSTAAEDTNTNGISAFNSDGFTLAGNSSINNGTIVAWCWKAGGSASSDSNGSITSSVSANTTAGFSIVAYTGNETAGATVGHGLGAVPQTYWVKSRSVADGWRIYHHKVASDPETDYLVLNNNNANADSHGYWNDTAPTSSVFSLGAAGEVNTNSSTNIAYCFTEIKGYSKIGKYVGNANADGPFVYTGFKPAWLMVKGDRADGWQIMDNKREGYNVISPRLLANDTASEYTNLTNCDFLSNGFKVRSNDSHMNYAEDYFYIAFAESPFVNSNGIPNNAR